MCKLSHWESFVLKVNEPQFYLLLFSSVMNLYPRSLMFMTFITLCCEHGVFYHLQKVRALDELMQLHLCPAMDSHPGSAPLTSLEPCLPCHQVLGSVLIRLPCFCLHSSPSCLHSSLSCSSPSQTPPPPPPPPAKNTHSGSSSRFSDKQDSLPSAPITPSSPHPLSGQLCWLCGVLSHPCLSVHTGPSVPEPGT